MELKLNIYNKKEIEKTYVSDTYDLMYGTIEVIFDVIDLDKITDNAELGKMVIRLMPLIKPFLKDVFDGLTDDELRRVKVKELVPLFVTIFEYGFSELNTLGGDSKK